MEGSVHLFWIYDTDRVSNSLFLYYYIDLFCTLTSNHFTLSNQPKCQIKNGACLENTFQTAGMHWDHSIESSKKVLETVSPNLHNEFQLRQSIRISFSFSDIWTYFVNNHSGVLCTEGGSFKPMACSVKLKNSKIWNRLAERFEHRTYWDALDLVIHIQ